VVRGQPELFVCPHVKDWQEYFADARPRWPRKPARHGVYIDEHGFGTRYCYSTTHGHPPGIA